MHRITALAAIALVLSGNTASSALQRGHQFDIGSQGEGVTLRLGAAHTSVVCRADAEVALFDAATRLP